MKTKLLLRAGLPLLWVIGAIACKQTDSPPDFEGSRSAQRASVLPFADTDRKTDANATDVKVWVCKSAGARKYHFNRDCGGLHRCTHAIEQTTARQAEAIGMTQCSYKKCQ